MLAVLLSWCLRCVSVLFKLPVICCRWCNFPCTIKRLNQIVTPKVHIAVEVSSFESKKTAAEKAYVSALCRILVLLQFRISEQGPIKFMRRLLHRVGECVSSEKDLVKELKHMSERLTVDKQPEQELSQDEVNLILGKLELDCDLDLDSSVSMPQTPAAPPTRPTRSRRRVKIEEESSDEDSPFAVPTTNHTVISRSQRASKTAAMNKMFSACRSPKIDEIEEQEKEDSVVTSEDSDD